MTLTRKPVAIKQVIMILLNCFYSLLVYWKAAFDFYMVMMLGHQMIWKVCYWKGCAKVGGNENVLAQERVKYLIKSVA